MFKLTIMTGRFASEASGPQKLQKYILRDLYASSLGIKTFLKVRMYHKHHDKENWITLNSQGSFFLDIHWALTTVNTEL